jgi:hypothetical protein
MASVPVGGGQAGLQEARRPRSRACSSPWRDGSGRPGLHAQEQEVHDAPAPGSGHPPLHRVFGAQASGQQQGRGTSAAGLGSGLSRRPAPVTGARRSPEVPAQGGDGQMVLGLALRAPPGSRPGGAGPPGPGAGPGFAVGGARAGAGIPAGHPRPGGRIPGQLVQARRDSRQVAGPGRRPEALDRPGKARPGACRALGGRARSAGPRPRSGVREIGVALALQAGRARRSDRRRASRRCGALRLRRRPPAGAGREGRSVAPHGFARGCLPVAEPAVQRHGRAVRPRVRSSGAAGLKHWAWSGRREGVLARATQNSPAPAANSPSRCQESRPGRGVRPAPPSTGAEPGLCTRDGPPGAAHWP